MKSVLCLLVAGVSVLPAPVIAQTVARENLVGTWLTTRFTPSAGAQGTEDKYQDILTLGADSTFTLRGRLNDVDAAFPLWTVMLKAPFVKGHWIMNGDSLWFSGSPAPVPARDQLIFKVAVQGQGPDRQLSFGYNYIRDFKGSCPRLFTRIDPAKPIPAVPLPASTLKLSDLVGTWTSTQSWRKGEGPPMDGLDTLTLGADSTWTHTKVGRTTIAGSWLLRAGDRIELRREDDSTNVRSIYPQIEQQGERLFVFEGPPCEEAKKAHGTWAYDRLKP